MYKINNNIIMDMFTICYKQQYRYTMCLQYVINNYVYNMCINNNIDCG